MILSTFNKELYERDLKEDAYEEGYDNGYGAGAIAGAKEGTRNALIELVREGVLTAEDAAVRLGISEEEVKEMI